MTKVEDNLTWVQKGLLSSDRVIFAVVCTTIIGVIVETGIIRVSGFEAVGDISADVKVFVGPGIFCVFSQLIILNFVRNKVGKSFLSRDHMIIGIINKAILIIQLGIIVLLSVVLLEVSVTFTYYTIFIKAVIISSFLTASALTALLSWRFIVWIRSNKNRLILAYLLASLFISASTIAGMAYFLDQLFYQPDVIYPKTYGEFISHVERGNSSLVYVYTVSSAIAFVLLWIGTVFLLRSINYQKQNNNSAPILWFKFNPARHHSLLYLIYF